MTMLVLDLIPAQVQFLPSARGPSASWRQKRKFGADLGGRIRMAQIDGGHQPVHESPHGADTGTMHQSTLRRRLTQCIRKRFTNSRPAHHAGFPSPRKSM